MIPKLWEVSYWSGGIAQTLINKGCRVYICRVPSTGHVQERAAHVKRRILQILDPVVSSNYAPGSQASPGSNSLSLSLSLSLCLWPTIYTLLMRWPFLFKQSLLCPLTQFQLQPWRDQARSVLIRSILLVSKYWNWQSVYYNNPVRVMRSLRFSNSSYRPFYGRLRCPLCGISTRGCWYVILLFPSYLGIHNFKVFGLTCSIDPYNWAFPLYRVSSITTLGTPHLGSPFADWGIKNILWRPQLERIINFFGVDTSAFHCLTTHFVRKEFNKAVLDHPNVKYYSFGGSRTRDQMPFLFKFAFDKVMEAEGPNDGLVSVDSCMWGHYLGTLEADHLEMINWHVRKYTRYCSRVPYRPFNALDLYQRLATFLAHQGHWRHEDMCVCVCVCVDAYLLESSQENLDKKFHTRTRARATHTHTPWMFGKQDCCWPEEREREGERERARSNDNVDQLATTINALVCRHGRWWCFGYDHNWPIMIIYNLPNRLWLPRVWPLPAHPPTLSPLSLSLFIFESLQSWQSVCVCVCGFNMMCVW